MVNAIDRLLSLAGPPLGSALKAHPRAAEPLVGELIQLILARVNGFYAFESSLHVFPVSDADRVQTVDTWNSPGLWRDRYQGMSDGLLFFAEDAFGVQFALRHDGIFTFDPETGEASRVAESLADWAAKIVEEFEFLTGYTVAHQWQETYGSLRPGQRLVPKRPFVLGGEYAVENLFSMEAVKSMQYRADLAVQIRDLPDGASITFTIVE